MCGMTVSQTRNTGAPDAFNLSPGGNAGVDAGCAQEGIGKFIF